MLAVFESLLARFRFRFLGRSPTSLGSGSYLLRQSFLSIATVAWFARKSLPKVQSTLTPFVDFVHLCAEVPSLVWKRLALHGAISQHQLTHRLAFAPCVSALFVFPEGAEKKLKSRSSFSSRSRRHRAASDDDDCVYYNK